MHPTCVCIYVSGTGGREGPMGALGKMPGSVCTEGLVAGHRAGFFVCLAGSSPPWCFQPFPRHTVHDLG